MTYSILGRDSRNGDLGIAVQSKFAGVGGLVPYGQAEVGVIATQAFANARHGSTGLLLLGCGATPEEVVPVLLRGDAKADQRQFGILDAGGRVAAYTGQEVLTWDGWSGSAAGDGCLALGNGLAGQDVVDSMVRSFEGGQGSLAERLISALAAGEAAGGDIRGQQSAALLVVRRDGGYGSLDDRHVAISVYDHPTPIDELVRCYSLHRMAYFASDPSKLVQIGPELAIELKQFMGMRGFFDGLPDGSWEAAAQRRLELFLGSENYDNRIDNGGLFDLEVLEDLRRRYGGHDLPGPRSAPDARSATSYPAGEDRRASD